MVGQLYLSGLLSGMATVVVGIVALVLSRRSQPRQARPEWAIAGIVVGGVATVLLVFPGGFLFRLGFGCAVNHMCV